VSRVEQRPLLVLVSGKPKMAEIHATFEEIVRVADGQKVPDPFVNTKKIIFEMCCVKGKPSFD